MIKRIFLITPAALALLLSFFMVTQSASAATIPRYGLGVVLGDPTGFTGKMFFREEMAVDAGFSYSFRDYFHLYSDFLFHFNDVFPAIEVIHTSTLRPYVGAGAGLRFSTKDGRKNGTDFFFRIPVGTEWLLNSPTLGIFLELVPAVGIAPDTFGDFYGGAGIRYYF